ncbi:recombination regulator RecX [Clostridium sp. K04]|uniref:recombination regulator RecX n=1 Tax=Clostridium sp. K04 TaxID=2718929 RepID=UPI0012B72C6B|nr:recombination regulator RecX [Clostridium sp. K04]MBX9184750.1 recombination regulator RecX [Clostridium sp. K04]
MNIITKIEVGKRNKERVNIYIDEEYAFSISAELIYKENIKVKDKIDVDSLKKLADEDNYIKCKNTALKTIERTYKSEKELVQKLALKGYDDHIINRTINFMKEYNLLNDNNYATMYVKDKSRNIGKKKIKYSLLQKGIDEEIIESELEKINNDEVKAIVYEMALKKYKVFSKRENDNYKLTQKLYRFLMGKGYDYDLIKDVVKSIVKSEDFE